MHVINEGTEYWDLPLLLSFCSPHSHTIIYMYMHWPFQGNLLLVGAGKVKKFTADGYEISFPHSPILNSSHPCLSSLHCKVPESLHPCTVISSPLILTSLQVSSGKPKPHRVFKGHRALFAAVNTHSFAMK